MEKHTKQYIVGTNNLAKSPFQISASVIGNNG
jgi:hypothetical protein